MQSAVAGLAEKFSEEEADTAFEESDPVAHMVHKATKQVESSSGNEVERLQAEVEQLRAGLAGASSYIGDIEEQPMPPVVGEGFVIPDYVVGDFVRTGRLIHRDGLVHGISGTLSMLALDQPNLVHMTAESTRIGQMDEGQHPVIQTSGKTIVWTMRPIWLSGTSQAMERPRSTQ